MYHGSEFNFDAYLISDGVFAFCMPSNFSLKARLNTQVIGTKTVKRLHNNLAKNRTVFNVCYRRRCQIPLRTPP